MEEKPAVKLVGEDGNIFSIMGRVQRAARKAGWDQKRINSIMQDMQSSDYNHALQVVQTHFEVE